MQVPDAGMAVIILSANLLECCGQQVSCHTGWLVPSSLQDDVVSGEQWCYSLTYGTVLLKTRGSCLSHLYALDEEERRKGCSGYLI